MCMQTLHVTVDFFFYLTDFSPLFTMTLCIQLQLHINYALLDDQGNKLPLTAVILFLSLFCSPPHPVCVNYLLQKIKLSILYIVGPPFLVKSETANLFLFLVVYICFASEVVVGCPLDPASRLDSEIQSWSMGNSLLTWLCRIDPCNRLMNRALNC